MAERAIRLTFEYDATGIRVIERDEITKDLPESDNVDSSSSSGFFVELRASDDSLVHERLVGAFLGVHAEHANDDGDLVSVEPDAVIPGVFQVIVPDVPAAREVVVLVSRDRMSSQMAQALGVGPGPAQPILRDVLREGDIGNV